MMEPITDSETEAMQIIWKQGETTVKQILEAMPEPKPPYTTLASVVKNLEKKKFVSSRLLGNVNVYKPKVKEAEYVSRNLADLVKHHFTNSYKSLITEFARQKKLSTGDLREIIELIEKES